MFCVRVFLGMCFVLCACVLCEYVLLCECVLCACYTIKWHSHARLGHYL